MAETPNAEYGLTEKYVVVRTDGRDTEGEKHHGCRYFVLDLTHDQHARKAVSAYAESVHRENHDLASDLRQWLIDTHIDGSGATDA